MVRGKKLLIYFIVSLLMFSVSLPAVKANAVSEVKSTTYKVKGKYEADDRAISAMENGTSGSKIAVSKDSNIHKGNKYFLNIDAELKDVSIHPEITITDKEINEEVYGIAEGKINLELPIKTISFDVTGELKKYYVDGNETYFGLLESTYEKDGTEYPVNFGFFYDPKSDTVTSSMTIGFMDELIGTSYLFFGSLSDSYKSTFDVVRNESFQNYKLNYMNTDISEFNSSTNINITAAPDYYTYKSNTFTSYVYNEIVGEGSNAKWVAYAFLYAQDKTAESTNPKDGYVFINTYTNSKNVEKYVASLGGKNTVAWVDNVRIKIQARNGALAGYTNLYTHPVWYIDFNNPVNSQRVPKLEFYSKNLAATIFKIVVNSAISLANLNSTVQVTDIKNNGIVKGKDFYLNTRLTNHTDFSTNATAEPSFDSDSGGNGLGVYIGYRSDLKNTKGMVDYSVQAVWLVSSDGGFYQGYYASREATGIATLEF